MMLKKSEEHVFGFFFSINKDAEQQSIEMAKNLKEAFKFPLTLLSNFSLIVELLALIVKSTKFMGSYQNELTNKYNTYS